MAAPDVPPPIVHERVDKPVHVHLHPRLVEPATMAGAVAVVIDNLRASATIAAALAAGATRVWPTLTVHDALARRDALAQGVSPPLLGGERGGTRIDGFDLGNSPAEYTPDRCRARDLVFTTTNGTAALMHARSAALILVASLANLSAVTAALANEPRDVHILCAGTRDEISMDDVLPAGALVERLLAEGREHAHGDGSRLALRAWREASHTPESLVAAMRCSRGGRNLAAIGMTSDVDLCSRLDLFPVVPAFDPATGAITRLA